MSETRRMAVTPLPAKPPAADQLPVSLPIDAIREAVRAEFAAALENVQSVAISAAMRASAEGVAAAKMAGYANSIHAVTTLLAVRLLLLLALLGGFALAVMALLNGGYQAAGVMVAYAVLVLIPLIYLEKNPRLEKPRN